MKRSYRLSRGVALSVVLLVTTEPGRAEEGLLYSSREIRGRVVDAETEEPISRALVVGMWRLSPTTGDPLPRHSDYHRRLKIVETLTDQRGEFSIPAWGPVVLPPFTELDETNPRIGVFKPGYSFHWWRGPQAVRRTAHGHTSLQANLKPFVGSVDERGEEAYIFFSTLHTGSGTDSIGDWRHYPMATAMMIAEKRQLRQNGLKMGGGPIVPDLNALQQQDRQLLERYLQ